MKKTPDNWPALAAIKTPSPHPKGWHRQRVQKVIADYDHQTDEEAIAEAAAAYEDQTATMLRIPLDLMPAVEKPLARRPG